MNKIAFDKVFEFDKKIRYCGIIDPRGKLIAGSMRRNLTSLEPESEDPRLFVQIAIAISMNRTSDEYFGKTKSILIIKEKVAIFVFVLSDLRGIVLATEPDLSLAKMSKLGELIDTLDFEVSNRAR